MQNISPLEAENILAVIRENMAKMLDSNLPLKILVKNMGYTDKVLITIPKLILFMMDSTEGQMLLKELGIDGKITELIHKH